METVTFEQAKKIDELGIKIDTYFVWDDPQLKGEWEVVERWMVEDDSMVMIPAPTVVEMLDRMPSLVDINDENDSKRMCMLKMAKVLNSYQIEYSIEWVDHNKPLIQKFMPIMFFGDHFSKVVGDMFIWCAEKGHLERK